ncbi:hypothetical protein ANO11243_041210 [Dothideomycetidae sp. 11243]|nr:hypothetical protein ANO11243_041210 [fungal sp. No.11243]
MCLQAIYEFHGDNESTAWRVIGLTARLSIELGLHRREIYEKMSPEDRDLSILLFWAIYTLDRRWSFGTGMPFALQDSDIDPQLPRPGDKSLYLTAMIDYCAIGSKVWQAIGADHIGSSTQSSITRENIKYLDYLTRHWYQSLPENLHFDHRILDNPSDRAPSSGSTRLRIVLYLRQNSMLINIYRPVLYSATNIMQNHAQAQEVVSVAKDTIRTLTRINQTSGIYQASQVLFNAFLTSALAVLFLAVSHAPAAFSSQVRDEFYLALDLVRGFSKGSFVSKRLWKTIRVLKEVGPKLGLATDSSGTSSAAEMRPTSAANGNAGQAPVAYGRTTPSASGPDNMANDLTRLFEAAGAFDGAGRASSASSGINGGGAYGPPVQQGIVDGGGMEIGFAGEDELSRIMRDLF